MSTKDELRSLLEGTAGFRFAGVDVQALQKPCVYLWLSGEVVQYVGMSKNGAERPFTLRHKRLKVNPSDELWVWPVNTVEQAKTVERAMIAAFNPPLNKTDSFRAQVLMDRLGVSGSRARRLRSLIRCVGMSVSLLLLAGCASDPIKVSCEAATIWMSGHRMAFCSDGSVRWVRPDLDDSLHGVLKQRL